MEFKITLQTKNNVDNFSLYADNLSDAVQKIKNLDIVTLMMAAQADKVKLETR